MGCASAGDPVTPCAGSGRAPLCCPRAPDSTRWPPCRTSGTLGDATRRAPHASRRTPRTQRRPPRTQDDDLDAGAAPGSRRPIGSTVRYLDSLHVGLGPVTSLPVVEGAAHVSPRTARCARRRSTAASAVARGPTELLDLIDRIVLRRKTPTVPDAEGMSAMPGDTVGYDRIIVTGTAHQGGDRQANFAVRHPHPRAFPPKMRVMVLERLSLSAGPCPPSTTSSSWSCFALRPTW
jgi:hypothetical protein